MNKEQALKEIKLIKDAIQDFIPKCLSDCILQIGILNSVKAIAYLFLVRHFWLFLSNPFFVFGFESICFLFSIVIFVICFRKIDYKITLRNGAFLLFFGINFIFPFLFTLGRVFQLGGGSIDPIVSSTLIHIEELTQLICLIVLSYTILSMKRELVVILGVFLLGIYIVALTMNIQITINEDIVASYQATYIISVLAKGAGFIFPGYIGRKQGIKWKSKI